MAPSSWRRRLENHGRSPALLIPPVSSKCIVCGAPGGIRTHDLWLRRKRSDYFSGVYGTLNKLGLVRFSQAEGAPCSLQEFGGLRWSFVSNLRFTCNPPDRGRAEKSGVALAHRAEAFGEPSRKEDIREWGLLVRQELKKSVGLLQNWHGTPTRALLRGLAWRGCLFPFACS